MSSISLNCCLICKDEVAPIEKISSSPENSSGKNAGWLLDCIRGNLFHSPDNQTENSSTRKVSLFCMACMEHAEEWREFKEQAKILLRKGQEVKSTVISLIIQSSLEIENDEESENPTHLPEYFRKICKEFAKLREEVAQEFQVDPDVDVQEQVLQKLKTQSSRLNTLSHSNGPKNGTEVKRGRGRPRLNPPKDLNAPKKPRGRPPKRSREESVQVTPERVSKRARVSPKKFLTNFIFQKSQYVQPTKRGRGRPPKAKVSEQEDGDEEERECSIDESQVATRLNKSATSDAEGHDRESPKEVATPVKKRRGRPKKNSVTPSLAKRNEKDGSDFENEKPQEPKKRGRGRPKKTSSPLETSQVSNKKPLMINGSPGAPTKRPRGRPKNPTSSGKSNSASEVRLPKTESSEELFESSRSQEEEDSQSNTDKPDSIREDEVVETELIIEVNADEMNGTDNEREKE